MSPEAQPPVEIIIRDLERVRALLGSQGLYDASQDEYKNPEHTDSVWQSVN